MIMDRLTFPNRPSSPPNKYIVVLITFFLLTACGANDSSDDDNGSDEKPVTQNVSITAFNLSPESIRHGEAVTMTATFAGGNGIIDQGVGSILSDTPVIICPEETTTYQLTVTSPGGTQASVYKTVTVQGETTAAKECGGTDQTPPDNTDSPLPVIHYFSASSSIVEAGTEVDLVASFSGGDGVIKNIGYIAPGNPHRLRVHTPTEYTLIVTNEKGQKAQARVKVDTREKEKSPLISMTLIKHFIFSESSENRDLKLNVLTNSKYEIKSVVASINGQDTILDWKFLGGRDDEYGYSGIINISKLDSGQWDLKVTATDHMGNTAIKNHILMLDRPPRFEISKPAQDAIFLTESNLHTIATCIDDFSIKYFKINVGHGNSVIQKGDGTSTQLEISHESDLSTMDGELIITLHCSDSSGRTTVKSIKVYAITNQPLEAVQRFNHKVIDLNSQNALLLDERNNILKIHNLTSNKEENIKILENHRIFNNLAYLTPTGIIFSTEATNDSTLGPKVFDWNKGLMVTLGGRIMANTFSIAGDYASWHDGGTIWRRQFSTGKNTKIGPAPSHYRNTVASDGTVFVWNPSSQGNIEKHSIGGTTTTLNTSDYKNKNLLTDGHVSVYKKYADNQKYALAYHNGESEILITDFKYYDPSPYQDYQINNGHISFTNNSSTEKRHVWHLSPEGTLLQRSYFGTDSYIETLTDTGDIIIYNKLGRYLSKPGEEPQKIGSRLGKTWHINGIWYLTLENELFKINPSL